MATTSGLPKQGDSVVFVTFSRPALRGREGDGRMGGREDERKNRRDDDDEDEEYVCCINGYMS